MKIIINANTREVIATVHGEIEVFKDNPYVVVDLGDKKPTFEITGDKIIFDGVMDD